MGGSSSNGTPHLETGRNHTRLSHEAIKLGKTPERLYYARLSDPFSRPIDRTWETELVEYIPSPLTLSLRKVELHFFYMVPLFYLATAALDSRLVVCSKWLCAGAALTWALESWKSRPWSFQWPAGTLTVGDGSSTQFPLGSQSWRQLGCHG